MTSSLLWFSFICFILRKPKEDQVSLVCYSVNGKRHISLRTGDNFRFRLGIITAVTSTNDSSKPTVREKSTTIEKLATKSNAVYSSKNGFEDP